MAGGSGVLDVDVDGAVGIRNEARAITDAISVNRIRYEAIARIAHGERPERIVGRQLPCRKNVACSRVLQDSLCPEPSLPVVQYIASCGTFMGPLNVTLHAARKRRPLPGSPHPNIVVQAFMLVT